MILGQYNIPTGISILGLFLSFSSIILSFKSHFEIAIVCFMYSGLCDYFDGYIARRLDLTAKDKEFGTQIDTLVDVVSFGVTPILFFLNDGLTELTDLLLFFIYLSATVIRLAHFSTHGMQTSNKVKYFSGVPVTYAALIFPVVYIFKDVLQESIFISFIRITVCLMSLFFVIKTPIPKPSGIFYVIFPLLAVALSFYFLYIR